MGCAGAIFMFLLCLSARAAVAKLEENAKGEWIGSGLAVFLFRCRRPESDSFCLNVQPWNRADADIV
jgi:hypothetical protein